MSEPKIITNHAQVLHWTVWSGALPDLSPSSVTSELFPNVRLAAENVALELLLPKMKKRELEGLPWNGPKNLEDLFEFAFNDMDDDAMKLMKKAFDTVFKMWTTVTFVNPANIDMSFTGYCPPHKARALMEQAETIHKVKKKMEEQPEKSEMDVRLEMMRGNCAVQNPNDKSVFFCGQPVACDKLCTHWCAPEEGNVYRCYYADRNPNQEGTEDAFWCLCEAAWKDRGGAKK